jgi:V/A-type H+-transporting ATPase subunit K
VNQNQSKFRTRVGGSLVGLALFMMLFTLFAVVPVAAEDGGGATVMTAEMAKVRQWGFISAAAAFGFGALGAGMAISSVGAAAMGAMSEKPEIGGQALIFIALAEGLVVFGFITALMILGKF